MDCAKCGNELKDTATTCPNCGARAPEVVPPRPVTAPGLEVERPLAITILGILNGLAAACLVLATVLLLLTAVKKGGGFLAAAVVCAVLAALHVACSRGLFKLQGYGRRLQILFALPTLLAIPFGTIVSVMVISYLLKPGMVALFSGRATLTVQQGRAVQDAHRLGLAMLVTMAVMLVLSIFITPVIAAIAIPNLLNAIQRGKQKRTMTDVRNLGIAVESYRVDHGVAPRAEDLAALRSQLQPTYADNFPMLDGWKGAYRYQVWGEDSEDGPTDYAIVSAGMGGEFEFPDARQYESGSTQNFRADIVFSNGQFLRYPQGVQR
jgi:hypothetical protein